MCQINYKPTKALTSNYEAFDTDEMCRKEFGPNAHAVNWYKDIKDMFPNDATAPWIDSMLQTFGQGNLYYTDTYGTAIVVNAGVSPRRR